MHRTTVRRVGDEFIVGLPPEIVAEFGFKEGDTLHATLIEGGVLLQPSDPGFAETMEAFEVIRRKYRNAFRELDD